MVLRKLIQRTYLPQVELKLCINGTILTVNHIYLEQKYGELSFNEEIFLDKLLTTLEQINVKLYKRLSRHKCFIPLSWVLGWGVYPDAHTHNEDKLKHTNFTKPKQIAARLNSSNSPFS